MISSVLVMAKEPRAGNAKTRLVPPFTHEQAAELAGAALWDTLRAMGRVPARSRVLAFDGDCSHWRPEGWSVVEQSDGDLDVRLAAAFAGVDGPGVLVGMDTPQVRAEQVVAFDATRFDACLGPATDGGYWAIGFADPRVAAAAIPGVAMSTDRTGEKQLQRLCGLGLRVQILDELTDFDTVDSAREVARIAPGTAFAEAFAAVGR